MDAHLSCVDDHHHHYDHQSVILWSLLNKLEIICPKTWIGVFLFMNQLGLKTFSFWMTIFGVWILLPMTLLLPSSSSASTSTVESTQQIGRVLLVTLLSPLSWECWNKTIWPVGKDIYNKLKIFQNFRKNSLPEAEQLYQQSWMQKRIIRTRRYDAYLPSSSSSSKNNNNNNKGILFFPGALIHHSSYVEVALQLANEGVLVVIPSMEPLRLASPWLGADPTHISRILHHVQKTISPGKQIQWAVGGHSLGGYAALRIAVQFQQRRRRKKKKNVVATLDISNKVVVWAAGNLLDNFIDATELQHLHCLFVQASEDNYCTFPTRQTFKEFQQKLPSVTLHKCIRGGNHCGFASYPMDIQIDGKLKISRHRQQQLASRETSHFLLHTPSFHPSNTRSHHSKT